MFTVLVGFIIIILPLGLCKIIKPVYRRWRVLRLYPNAWQLLKIAYLVDKIFDRKQAYCAAQQDRQLLPPNLEFTYGEIPFPTLVSVLTMADARAGEVFYDLGAGDGKAALCSAMIIPFRKVYAIELLPSLHQLSCEYAKQLCQLNKISSSQVTCLQADYYQVNFNDADIVYINATGIFGRDWLNLVEKFNQLPINARVIITSRTIDSAKFQQLTECLMPMSWGMNRIAIYRKISA